MHEIYFLKDLVIILGFGVIVVTILRKLKVPTITGFIVVGLLVGPHGLKLINDPKQVEILAEIGVTLLLFGIGLEFPLERFKRLWQPILAGGTLQVGLTIIVVYFLSQMLGLPSHIALFTGFIVAISSTAIVLQELEQRGEIDAPHGRFTLGILIFQDLCVVPMVLIVPLLAEGVIDFGEIGWMLGRTAIVIAVILAASKLIVPRVLNLIAKANLRYLFVMATLTVCVGTAWLTGSFGVSLALGAFLGGLVVAGSEFRHQAFADILPFREIFVSFFFISVGMLLDWQLALDNMTVTIILLVSILVGKFLIIMIAGAILRMPLRVSAMTAVSLSQVGEFSFVLVSVAIANSLVDQAFAGSLLVVTVLSMIVTPFILNLAPKLAAGIGGSRLLTKLLDVPEAVNVGEQVTKQKMSDHVIIGGYGLAGQQLAEQLLLKQVPYVIAELNPENVRTATQDNRNACYADITSGDVLEKLGLHRAKMFVIVINDPKAAERAVRMARKLSSKIKIVVRTRYILDVVRLKDAGADEVIVAEIETASKLVTDVMQAI